MSPQDEIVNKISKIRWELLKLPTKLRKEVDQDLLTLQNKINKWK
jgi:hypothetical protein